MQHYDFNAAQGVQRSPAVYRGVPGYTAGYTAVSTGIPRCSPEVTWGAARRPVVPRGGLRCIADLLHGPPLSLLRLGASMREHHKHIVFMSWHLYKHL